jgi:hypothetical protein
LYDRLDTICPFSRMIVTHSMAVRTVSMNRFETVGDGSQPNRRPSVARAERILAADRGALETVSFSFLTPGMDAVGDTDLRYAAPQSQVPFLLSIPKPAAEAGAPRAPRAIAVQGAARRSE